MGRHGHDEPSWPPPSYTLQILLLLSLLPSTNRYDGPFQERRSIEGLHSIILKLLGNWVLGLLSDHYNEPAGRTVDGPSWTSIPHLVRLPHLPLAASLRCHLRTVTSTTDRHKLRRWSLLHFFSQNLRFQL